MKKLIPLFAIAVLALLSLQSYGQDAPSTILITNANIFDGTDELVEGKDVLIKGNKIEQIAKGIVVTQDANTTIIDAGGRTLTPGFIDAHVHLSLQVNYAELTSIDEYYFAFKQADEAEKMLLRGFTSVRDMGGNTFSLRRAIDEGLVAGPRLYPSGGAIGQTGGHGDYRAANAVSRLDALEPQPLTREGHTILADGPTQVLTASREQLRKGATQIKIFTGGGAASPTDPLDVVEMTNEEIRAAVQAAENWNTYVASHVYNVRGIRNAVENGVMSIEHANFIDEKTLDIVMEKGVWLSVQALVFVNTPEGLSPDVEARFKQALTGLDQMFSLVNKKGYKKIGFGTDVIADPALLARQNEEFTLRNKWFEPAEIIRQATSGNAELLAMSGPRNPYPDKLGVIEEGAYADILLIKGNPLENLELLTNYEENIQLIMKDGKIYKNTIKE